MLEIPNRTIDNKKGVVPGPSIEAHNMLDQAEKTPGKEAEKEWAVGRRKTRRVL